MRINSLIAAVVLNAGLTSTGCAVRQPVSRNWRFIKNDADQVLIPPGIAAADVAHRTFAADVTAGQGHCPPSIRLRKKRAFVTVTSATFLQQPQGWLTAWADGIESQGCIAPGEGPKLAAQVAESLPLDPDVSFRGLYPNEIIPPVRLQVVSPILRDPAKPDAPAEVSGNGNTLTLTVKSSDNLIGFETALYTVQPKSVRPDSPGIGFDIVPLYADRNIERVTERRAQPATNYFHFPPGASFYRLFIKSGQTDFTALVIAATTRAELDRSSQILDAGTASCDKLPGGLCVAIPRRVALNAVVPVTVNGVEVLVRWGANLGEAIRNSGERQPEAVLPNLTISRLYNNRPTPVDFDHSNPAILRLVLTGGEIVAWSRS